MLRSRSFEDFPLDEQVVTRRRTVTEADIALFAGLTWDFYPLHTDEEFCRHTPFGTRIAHGPMVYSMAVGMMPIDFFGDSIIAFLGVDGLRHLHAVKPGDTIGVHARVVDRRLTSRSDRGVVVIEYAVFNQREEMVMRAKLSFLMRCRDGAGLTQGGVKSL